MSFKRLDPEDFLISTDAIVAPCFAGGSSDSTATTLANSGVSTDYYSAFESSDDNRVEVTLTYGNITGSLSGSQVVYRQFANIIQGDAESNLAIGSEFVGVVIERQRFKQSILPSTFKINGAVGGATPTEAFVLTGSTDVTFTDAGRQFKNASGDMYLYPDIGVALLAGGNSLANSLAAGRVTADSEEVLTSNYVFIRARNAEFNYSQNPTFIDSTTGGVRYTDFITAPQTFITTVGLYNDNGDCLAVAKLSKPLKKDFTKEALIRVKLDF